MDELEAMKILKNETPMSEEEILAKEKARRRAEEWKTVICVCLLGLFIITLLYSIIVHPIDKILIKLALIDNYAITTKVADSKQTVLVDGNIICVNDTYYEVTDDGVYVYRKNGAGKWTKEFSNSLDSGADTSWVNDILNKDNYKRNILFWKPMEYIGGESGLGMENVKMRVVFGKCTITGTVEGIGMFGTPQTYLASIKIHKFGLAHLRLPKIEK